MAPLKKQRYSRTSIIDQHLNIAPFAADHAIVLFNVYFVIALISWERNLHRPNALCEKLLAAHVAVWVVCLLIATPYYSQLENS